MNKILLQITREYPQLLLPLSCETKTSPEYKAAVLRGEPLEREPEFISSPNDDLSLVPTPAGEARIWYLENRGDFEHAYQALAFRCEPRPILPSVGAATISGLINWGKIRAHRREFLRSGGLNWSAEFREFTSVKSNYCDTIILLSSGFYSSVDTELVGMDAQSWQQKSIQIRKYHELTHFVCRKLYPDRIDVLRDEILADCIGLIAAFGDYNPALARLFLGIERSEYRPGGRLEHYIADPGELPAVIQRAHELIDTLSVQCTEVLQHHPKDVFEILTEIF